LRPIPECLSAIQRVRNEGERAAGNMPIQGSAQAVIKLAMAEYDVLCKCYRDMGKVCQPLLQIHDELLTEVEEDIVEEFREQVRLIMMNAVKISVPVNASSDVAFRWGDLK
jgi:DNA polymerase-1